jgi:hypothetical protein
LVDNVADRLCGPVVFQSVASQALTEAK